MDDLGYFPDPSTVRFERALPTAPARVWEYLTDSALVSTWLAVANVEPRLGGRIELRMQPKVAGQRVEDCPIIEGTIARWEPAKALTFTWRNIGPGSAGEPASELRFELHGEGNHTRLVLEHARLPREWLARVAGGWHYLLNELHARLENRESEPTRPWPRNTSGVQRKSEARNLAPSER